MKIKLGICLGFFAFALNLGVYGQSAALNDTVSNYVVIGAFRVEAHAATWVRRAKSSNFKPVSALNKNRKLYYVYVMRTADRPAAFEQAAKIRKDTVYWDTWVYTGNFTTGLVKVKEPEPLAANAFTASALSKDAQSRATAPEVKTAPSTGTAPEVKTQTPQERGKISADSIAAVAAKKDSVAAQKPDDGGVPPLPGAKVFFFNVRGEEAQEVIAKVDVIDVDRARKTGTYAGNKLVYVNPPSKSGNISIVAQTFGYRRGERSLNFFNPSDSGNVVITDDRITIPFNMTRLKKGDFAVMYNVYFFKDAAVMRPESKYEVNSLVAMMKENPKYKIRIHGHTNGNASGKVTSMGDSKNFFSLTDSKDGFGSAKKLSEERAKMIRSFLVDQGIDMKRMEIKAWGGKKPVYDKDSPQAQANVRVEIEILDDK